MARRFGLNKRTMLDAASGIGLIGEAAGMGQGSAADLGNNMSKLAADASSFYNIPLDEALQKIKSGLVGGPSRSGARRPARQESVKAEAAERGSPASGAELTPSQKVMPGRR